jgi:hypothetical protein
VASLGSEAALLVAAAMIGFGYACIRLARRRFMRWSWLGPIGHALFWTGLFLMIATGLRRC